jgi:hypothetical protein
MIKKMIVSSAAQIVLALLTMDTIHGHTQKVLIEAKAACFISTNHLFKKIYHRPGGIYGLEATFQLCDELYGWTSGSFFTQKGYSINGHNRTRVTFVPIGFGIKYLIACSNMDFYAGAGVLATYLQTKDDSPFVFHRPSKWGVGGIWKAGCNIYLSPCIFLDIFADYSYIKIGFNNTNNGTIQRHKGNLSGASLGAGIGYKF